MLYEQVKSHILHLSDVQLLEYVLTGHRMYEADAVTFARQELERRAIPPAQLQAMRNAIVPELIDYDLRTQADFIMGQLADGTDICDIAREIAPIVGISPGEAWCALGLLCQQLVAQREAMRQPPTFGFPVIQAQGTTSSPT